MSLVLTFRPNNLDEILGQYELVEVFKKFIAMQKLPHSLFFGVAGSGKTSFARAVAKEFGLDFYEFDGGNFKLAEFLCKVAFEAVFLCETSTNSSSVLL